MLKKLFFLPFLWLSFPASASPPISLWIMQNDWQARQSINRVVASFEQATGIPVHVTILDWDIAFEKISRALATGTAPQVLQLGSSWVPHFASRGLLYDLTRHTPDFAPARFHPPSLQACRIEGRPGLFAVPWFIDLRLLVANRRHLERAGVDPGLMPDYPGFCRALEKLRRAELQVADRPVRPFGYSGKGDWNLVHYLAPWIWAEGGDYVFIKNGKRECGLLDPATVRGIARYLNLVRLGWAGRQALLEPAQLLEERFTRGEFAIIAAEGTLFDRLQRSHAEGGYLGSRLAEDGAVALPYPAGNAPGRSFFGGSALAIPRIHTGNNNAVILVAGLTAGARMDRYCRDIGQLPPDRGLWKRYAERPGFTEVIAALSNARTHPNIPEWGEVEVALVETMGQVMEMTGGGAPPEALYPVLAEGRSRINRILRIQAGPAIDRREFAGIFLEENRRLEKIGSGSGTGTSAKLTLLLVPALLLLILTGIAIHLYLRRVNKPNPIRKRHSLVSKLILILAFAQLAVVLAIGMLLTVDFRNEAAKTMRERNANLAGNIAQYVDAAIGAYARSLSVLASLPAFVDMNREEIRRSLLRQEAIQLFLPGEKVFVIDSAGRQVADNSTTVPYLYREHLADFHPSVLRPPDPWISGIRTGPGSPRLDIAVSIDIRSRGAVVGQFSLRRIRDLFEAQTVGERGFVALADTRGVLLAVSDGRYPDAVPALFTEASRTPDGTLTLNGETRAEIDGRPFLVSWRTAADGRLRTVVCEEQPTLPAVLAQRITSITLLVLAAMLITTLIAVFVYGLLINPVNRLSELLTAGIEGPLFEREGDRRYLARRDELGVLFRKFRELADAVRERDREKNSLIERIEAQNAELIELDRMKDEFLAGTSHELRTPLHGIVGISESLLAGAAGELSPGQRHNLSLVVNSGRRLEGLIDDILDFSLLRHDRVALETRALDLHGAVQLVLDVAANLPGAKDIVLANGIDPAFPPVSADENRLQQILYNLIGNAVKFTPHGTVTVTAQATGEHAQISVTDTGVGIPGEKLTAIFDAFVQADGAASRGYGGAGLGLAISRSLVSLHGGTLTVDSKPGQGSSFRFTIPLAGKDGQAPASASGVAVRRAAARVELPDVCPDLLMPGAMPHPESTPFSILLVDDEPVNLQVLANQLALQGYRVSHAADGPAALARIASGPPLDLILLDLMMPGMNGFEVCRKIREQYSLFELPILILTARNTVGDIERGFADGANDYLTKPFDRTELLSRVRTLLALKQAVHDNAAYLIMKQELEMARRFQESILPVRQPEAAGLRFAAAYRPMTQVGGDFYDYCLPGDGRVGVLIADISGHGVPAALIAAMAKIAFANQREHAAHPDRVLDGIHRMLSEKIDSNFITAGYAWIDRPQLLLRCAGAGHPPLLLYRRATGETHELKPAGSLIGWMTRADCAVEETTLEPGDRIILYTDGILEAADTADEEYGETRFHALIGQTADEPAQLLIERLFAEIRDWTGREQLDDDLTIVVIDVV